MSDAQDDPTPRGQGFRWPAEWEPHEATLLAWPHDPTTWPGGVEHAERAMAAFAAAVSRGERVDLLVRDEAMAERAEDMLGGAQADAVRLVEVETADVWFRDYGPITLVKGQGDARERLSIDFTFNAWGGKYEELLADDTIPARIQPLLDLPLLSTDFVLEGGSIEGDGEGTLLTTEQCLLNANRNPDLDRDGIAEALSMFLGIEKVLWLGEGVAGDDTDGHIDDITRFVAPGKVVTCMQPDKGDPDHKPLKA
ncbi:MAG: agmatine deiminase family protein, partial [Planctomycetota bacterium]|nr:agmatine deiminase family protein [Planctomycetota bacterium]